MDREYIESNFEIIEKCKSAAIWKGFTADQQWWIVSFALEDFPVGKDFSMRSLKLKSNGSYDLKRTAWAFDNEAGARQFYNLHT